MSLTAEGIIQKLKLIKHPQEGGYYRATFRDSYLIHSDDGFSRPASTCIYYLITPDEFSLLHRLTSSEIFHFYLGDPVEMIHIDEKGKLTTHILGHNIQKGEVLQVVVPPKVWEGARLVEGGSWALLGCTTVPGFEFKDFVGGTKEILFDLFPQHKMHIDRFTRN